jgi:hypothetical protein
MRERDSCILWFLNELNLTYPRLIGFVVSFDFIPIVLVLWGRFSLCHSPIRSLLAFRDRISILIVGYVTIWLQGSYHHEINIYPNMKKIKNITKHNCQNNIILNDEIKKTKKKGCWRKKLKKKTRNTILTRFAGSHYIADRNNFLEVKKALR